MDPGSALSHFPSEIFCRIFALASDGQSLKTTQGPWAISKVCSRWRSIVLSTPTLWTRLQINLALWIPDARRRRNEFGWPSRDVYNDLLDHMPFADDFDQDQESFVLSETYAISAGARENDEDLRERESVCSPGVQRGSTHLSEWTIARLREQLGRSQSAPLDVKVYIPSAAPPTTPYLIPFIELLFSQSHRFKSLSTDISASVITPDYKKLGNVRRLKTNVPSSFAFNTLSLPVVTACHFVLEGTSTPPFTSEPRKEEERLDNLRELVLESQNPIHAQDLQVPIGALQLPKTLASLTIRNLALSVAVVKNLPETQKMRIIKGPKAYMTYLPEDVIVALINKIDHRLDNGLLRSVSVQGFTVPKLDSALWCRIEALNERENVDIQFIRLWQ
ncbi:uncharacterized protein EV420DRAFT_1563033 [Desarmillaria tabescens]|uniref:F-box domain-containing protein n=1 Tax=Armillaria tabescens TaxID=1929756 RepID=A0AA39JWY7_ARMTA|nr:uncharacterized protein EV420DRAFT_1563033 [Desarmillaria tabescens]KAK0450344.1 hypothetical protein EV420DRAFT_1563033 [Desarmillaria tabescens]